MGILTRMTRLWKADLHGVMDQLEDKGLLLKQYLREMEDSLQHKETRLAQLTQLCQRIQRDLAVRGEEIAKLEKDLDLAVRKEKDDIAKLLIRKRHFQKTGCTRLQRQLQVLGEEKVRLAENCDQQRLQYEELKVKAGAYCQQAAQRNMPDVAKPFGDYSGCYGPSEEEIELELIQRKEAVRQGGAS